MICVSNNELCNPVIAYTINNMMKMRSNLLKKRDLWGKYKKKQC